MILFLVITSIVNVAVGYWLAVYLAKNSPASSALPPDATENALVQSIQRTAGAPSAWPAAATAAAVGSGVHAAPPQDQTNADLAPRAELPAEDAAVQTRTAAMEQDLLAGIEEFRHQLAQLKAKGAGPLSSPVVAS